MVTYIKLIAPVMVQRKQAGCAMNLNGVISERIVVCGDGKPVSVVTCNK